jgi:predicted branched-subunit amino acid permease
MNEAAQKPLLGEKWMHGLNVTAYSNWFIANIAGAFFGQRITNPGKFGLDFALPAMFIGLLVLQMASRSKIAIDILVAVSAVILVVGISLICSSSLAVIAATVAASTIGMVIEKWK